MSDTNFVNNVTVVQADWLQDVNNYVYRQTKVDSINSMYGPVALLGGANVTLDNSIPGQITINATGGGGGGGVASVNGKVGAVNITAGTNITIDNSGAGIVINAPGGGGGGSGVSSFNARTGAVTLTGGDVTSALGYTPYNSANPNGYLSSISSPQVVTALGYTPVPPTRLFSTGQGLTGGGDLSVNRTLSVVPDSTVQQINVYKNNAGSSVVTRSNISFIEGANTTISVTDHPSANLCEVTISSTGGGGGVSSFNTRTGAISLTYADVTGALGFLPYNTTNPAGYVVENSSPNFGGVVRGNGGGKGLGQITLTTVSGTPTGGTAGDLRLVY